MIFESICRLLCGIGVFLAGMKLMGDGMGRESAKSVRLLFRKVGDRSLPSYFFGVGATAIVQSSAATTIMSMELVDAHVMTTLQAAAFVLGARLGTTATGILVSLSSFSITPLLMTLAFVGIFLVLFSAKEKIKSIGFILTGLGVLFAGMDMMTGAIIGQKEISSFFISLFNALDFPPLLILSGALFTALIQSSSATTGLLVTLLSAGSIETNQAAFILIGATVGTCVTALLSSLGAKDGAKQIALFNLLSSLFGVLTVGNVVWLLASLDILRTFFNVFLPAYKGWQLALFGVLYSFSSSALCLPFIPLLLKTSRSFLPSRQEKKRL